MTAARRRSPTKEQKDVPPQSREAEIAVLGGILQSRVALEQAAAILRPGDFYLDAHRHIFSAALALHVQGAPVDPLSVGEFLQCQDQLQAVGGGCFLASLVDQTPSAANVAYYARLVRNKAKLRQIAEACTQAAQRATSNGTDPGAVLADFWEKTRQLDGSGDADAKAPALDAPVAVLRQAREWGEPIPTGIPAVDARLRSGLPTRKALVIGGTAGSGKTTLLIQAGMAASAASCAVACLMVDEGREAAIIRVGQQLGYPRAEIEEGREAVLDTLEEELAGRLLFFPDPDGEADTTIEGVAEALVHAYPTHRKLLLVDSIQTVRTRRPPQDTPSIRERVMEAARTARRLAVEHDLAVIYTSEVNRSWYRARKEEDRASDLAAFAEARIEFSADVLLAMRASEEDPDLVEVRVAKNRLGHRTSFLLRLDRVRARFTEVEGDYARTVRDAAEARRMEEASEAVLRELRDNPGLTRGQLKELVHVKAGTFCEAIKSLRASGIIRCETQGKAVRHYLSEVPR